MSNRFEPIGSFVYEKGNRIGVTPDEASVELARKLNAYQMRIERLKAEVDRLRKSGDQMATVLSDLLQSDLIPCSISRGVIKSTLDKWNADPKESRR